MDFFIASPDDIRAGRTTDIYFRRTAEILKELDVHKEVVAEFTVSSLPKSYDFALFAGLESVLSLLEGLPVNLYGLMEGDLFRSHDETGVPVPVLVVEGDYASFGIYETPVLGFICQNSGIATKSARVRIAAGDHPVISFGIRRMHPALAPTIDRAAYIGGCDDVSSVIGAETVGTEPKGTMPHALIITLGESEAWKEFDSHMPDSVPRVALIDTYGDEKAKAIEAAETIPNLRAVRLDTPGSRRGDFAKIVREVRWELDIRGYERVGIFLSGGLSEEDIPVYSKAGAAGFGVGTSISNAPTIDFAMDIVEMEGTPVAKKGKFGGRKAIYRCESCLRFLVLGSDARTPECPNCGSRMIGSHTQFLSNGKRVLDIPEPSALRERVLRQLDRLASTHAD
jgi:nicotinate phosphoribosyltransferase